MIIMGKHLVTLGLVMVLVSCATDPAMHVTKGLSPEHVDDKVLFQTTYYFRVFDYCARSSKGDESSPYQWIPITDAYYRYRMTGKAHALMNHVRFESGVLKSHEIDPFGTQVEYDKAGKGFRIVDANEIQARSLQSDSLANLKELQSLKKSLQDSGALTEHVAQVDQAIAANLSAYSNALLGRPQDSTEPAGYPTPEPQTVPSNGTSQFSSNLTPTDEAVVTEFNDLVKETQNLESASKTNYNTALKEQQQANDELSVLQLKYAAAQKEWNEIDAAQGRGAEKSTNISARIETLEKERVQLINDRDQTNQARNERIDRANVLLLEKNQLKNTLIERQEKQSDLVSEQEQLAASAENEARARELAQVTEELAQVEGEIGSLQREISTRDQSLQELGFEIARLETGIEAIDGEIANKEQALTAEQSVRAGMVELQKTRAIRSGSLQSAIDQYKASIDIATNRVSQKEEALKLAKTNLDNTRIKLRQLQLASNALMKEPTIECNTNIPRRKGFQIIGPEGWRTFEQDERLIMAMYSDASPIIGVMKEVAARSLNQAVPRDTQLLPLVREQLATTNIINEVRTLEIGLEQVQAKDAGVLEGIIKKFEQGDGNAD